MGRCGRDSIPDAAKNEIGEPWTPVVAIHDSLTEVTGPIRASTTNPWRSKGVSDTNTGAYCRARRRIPEAVPKRLALELAGDCEEPLPDESHWQGHRSFLVDGTTFSMPDTSENHAESPQPSSQSEGLGFPIVRAVALLSLATAMVQGLALRPYAGKETGETALLRQLFPLLKAGDVVAADRYYAGWFTIALLQDLGVEVVTRLHQHCEADFRRGQRLGADDHCGLLVAVEWSKPQRPAWLDQETYDRLPDRLSVREMKFAVLLTALENGGGGRPKMVALDC